MSTNFLYYGADDVSAEGLDLPTVHHIYVAGGVRVGSSTDQIGISVGASTEFEVHGEVLSVAGDAISADGGALLVNVAVGGSISGSTHAVVTTAGASHITNDGNISGGYGLQLGSGDNTVLNSGHINGYAGQAIALSGGNNFITNTGTISSSSDYAIALTSAQLDAANTLDNSGTIIGSGGAPAISMGDAAAVVTNSGHIAGNITLGASDDSYDGSLGTVTGLVFGGGGDDELTGGAGRDQLRGGTGSDTLDGGSGKDIFVYNAVSESGGTDHDTIVGFDAHKDKFDLNVGVTGIDATVVTGELRAGHFTADLASAIGKTDLAAHHAVLFTPSTGDLAGETVLIVDANGKAGYQANADYVMVLHDPASVALTVHDFI